MLGFLVGFDSAFARLAEEYVPESMYSIPQRSELTSCHDEASRQARRFR